MTAIPTTPTTVPAQKFTKLETESDSADDFFTVEVGGIAAQVFRPLKDGKRLANFYVKGNVRGRQFYRGTGFATKGLAAETARKLWRAQLEGRTSALDETKLRVPKKMATIGEILAAYEAKVGQFNLRIKPEIVAGNCAALRVVLAHALGKLERAGKPGGRNRIDQEEIGKLSGAELSERLVERCLANYVGTAGADRVLKEQRIRGVSSVLCRARAVFAKQAMKCYRDLTMPESLAGFMSAGIPQVKAPPQNHIEPRAMMEMALAALELRESNPPLYLVHLLSRHLGMRNDEIEMARVEWIEMKTAEVWLPKGERREIGGFMVIKTRAYWSPKQSEGEVPIAPEVLVEIQRLIAGRKPEEFLIAAAHPTARAELVDRTHNDFVRPWTAHFRKKGYELRRWASTLVAERQGEEMAERFLRHKAKSVAGKFYMTRTVPPAPITFTDCGLGWFWGFLGEHVPPGAPE